MLYIISLVLIYLTNGSLYLLNTSSNAPFHFPNPISGNHMSELSFYELVSLFLKYN